MDTIPEQLRNGLADRYDVSGAIGRGGMATVYRAVDRKHSREVAVKVLRDDLAASLGVDRFLREIEIAAQLNHPHILPLLDSGEENGVLYYVMPFMAGGSLRNILNEEGTVHLSETLRVGSEVAGALASAHRRGVVHRDIKPENILFQEGLAIVGDFGIAKAVSTAGGAALTRTGFPIGTPGYMSPEQAAGLTDLDPRTDVYSLACVIYEMLIGDTPGLWLSEDAQRLERFVDAVPAHRERLDTLPGGMESVLVTALALRSGSRQEGPVELMEALGVASARPRRFDSDDVDDILSRAAGIEASSPTDSRQFSAGTIQQIGAEVGLSPQHVRRALEQSPEPGTALEPVAAGQVPARGMLTPMPVPTQSAWSKAFVGSPTRFAYERVVEGEIDPNEYLAMVETIRSTVGFVGQVNTLGKALTWSQVPSAQDGSGRAISLTITPHGGITRIRAEERHGGLVGGLFGGLMGGGGGGVGGMTLGIGIGEMGLLVAPIIGAAAVVGGFWLLARGIYNHVSSKRSETLKALVDRLAMYAEETIRAPRRIGGGS